MKFFKQIIVTALAMHLLLIIASRQDRVEIIPGGLNSTGLAEPVNTEETAFDTNGLIGYRGFAVL